MYGSERRADRVDDPPALERGRGSLYPESVGATSRSPRRPGSVPTALATRSAGFFSGLLYTTTRDIVTPYELYARHVFPRIMEWAIGGEAHLELRREALADARGRVLEVGFGTGLNLSCYPPDLESLTAGGPKRLLESRVRARIARAPFPVLRARLDGAHLPFRSASFDTAVSTWTLCTIPDVEAALGELRRVLTPSGRLLFMEHGRSDDPRVASWQDRLNPIERAVACGCHLNRRIDRLIEQAGFRIAHPERFRMPRAPRVVGEVYRGTAIPA